MMQLIKTVIKNTPLHAVIRRAMFNTWTARDQEMLEFYSQFFARNALCFDVGANIGNRVKIFLKMQSNVVAIEPQADCVAILRMMYGNNRRLAIIQKALGETAGEAEIMLGDGDASVLSSLSPEWIEAVRKSGRFPEHRWERKQVITVTTLDSLIEQYGTPDFIKIDVEGFEHRVVRGLSQPVNTLSLEFTPEYIESTFQCIKHLQSLGNIRLNYSIGETMRLALAQWVTTAEMFTILSGHNDDRRVFGDVYIQFQR